MTELIPTAKQYKKTGLQQRIELLHCQNEQTNRCEEMATLKTKVKKINFSLFQSQI